MMNTERTYGASITVLFHHRAHRPGICTMCNGIVHMCARVVRLRGKPGVAHVRCASTTTEPNHGDGRVGVAHELEQRERSYLTDALAGGR